MISKELKMVYRCHFLERKLISYMDGDDCNISNHDDGMPGMWVTLCPDGSETVSAPRPGYYTFWVPIIVSKPLEYIKIDFEVTNDSGSNN